MTKLIVVLVLTDQLIFLVGVETSAGLSTGSFPNNERAADHFFEFVNPLVEREGASYAVCLVHTGDGDYGHIGNQLVAEGVKPSLLASAAYEEYATRAGLDVKSLTTAAKACVDVFKVFGPQRF